MISLSLRTAEQLLQLIDKIAEQNPHVSDDRLFSYVCQRSTEIRTAFRECLASGLNRADAQATIGRALLNLVEQSS